MKKNIAFLSETHRMVGILDERSGQRAVVITHPHPLYGGDMHNPVVACIHRAFVQNGYTTLRFNFRGVNGSGGRYTDGPGEKTDVRAAISYLADRGIPQIGLAGYSFGAWVNAQIESHAAPVNHLLMVSPPVAFMDFSTVGPLAGLGLVVTGSADDIAPAAAVGKSLRTWNRHARLAVISGADHFYLGHMEALAAELTAYLNDRDPADR